MKICKESHLLWEEKYSLNYIHFTSISIVSRFALATDLVSARWYLTTGGKTKNRNKHKEIAYLDSEIKNFILLILLQYSLIGFYRKWACADQAVIRCANSWVAMISWSTFLAVLSDSVIPTSLFKIIIIYVNNVILFLWRII